MDHNQSLLIELLSLAIRGGKVSAEKLDSVDWDALLQMAQDHSVLPLVYTSLSSDSIHKYDLVMLKSITYRQILQQTQNMEILRCVIDGFEKAGIPLLAMKGLALKDLYPVPETRTMCDFDLVVHENQFDDAISVLLKTGFREAGENRNVHAGMIYGDNLLLELHRKPFAGERYPISPEHLNLMWDNAVPLSIAGKTILTFSNNDTIFYLFLHLAKHYENGGFGLRQLCDIVLFIEAEQKDIDWKKFYWEAEQFHITRFVLSIITICNHFFNMTIPEFFKTKLIQDERVELFIQDIIRGGVYGKVTVVRSASGSIVKKIGLINTKGLGIFKAVRKFLFPSAKELYLYYPYIKKYPFLLPAAWVHRWVFNLARKDRREMMKVFLKKDTAKELLKIIESRSQLVNWLLEEDR